jgi:hypothetical protein
LRFDKMDDYLEKQLNLANQSNKRTISPDDTASGAAYHIMNGAHIEDPHDTSKSQQHPLNNEPMLVRPLADDDLIPTHHLHHDLEDGRNNMSSRMMTTTTPGDYGVPPRGRLESARQAAPTPVYQRVIVCIVGCFAGFVSLPANMMLSDSGTTKAKLASMIGVSASCMCCIGGIQDIWSPRGGGWWLLSLGVVLQAVVLLLLGG